MENRNPALTEMLSELMGTDIEDDIQKGVCTFCGCDAHDFKNEVSKVEYQISGLCQECQDDAFSTMEIDDEHDNESCWIES